MRKLDLNGHWHIHINFLQTKGTNVQIIHTSLGYQYIYILDLLLHFFLSDTLISSQNSFEKLRERTWVNKADKRKKMDIIKVQPKICSIVFQN